MRCASCRPERGHSDDGGEDDHAGDGESIGKARPNSIVAISRDSATAPAMPRRMPSSVSRAAWLSTSPTTRNAVAPSADANAYPRVCAGVRMPRDHAVEPEGCEEQRQHREHVDRTSCEQPLRQLRCDELVAAPHCEPADRDRRVWHRRLHQADRRCCIPAADHQSKSQSRALPERLIDLRPDGRVQAIFRDVVNDADDCDPGSLRGDSARAAR